MRPPSVDALARTLHDTGLPHPLCVVVAREAIASGEWSSARDAAVALRRRMLQPVVNATGVLLHTNLGRAPLGVDLAGDRYTNLELDLGTGRRGSRFDHVGGLFATLTGADAAVVVNNGAAAVLLVLAALAGGGGRVVVSRGELVEIGGGFRVPEVMAQSGAELVEVGTTNRTRPADYAAALDGGGAAAVLKVHQSNYRIVGFTEQVGVADIVSVVEGRAPVIVDAGSGLLDAAAPWLPGGPPVWLTGEPAVRQVVAAGASLVTFSGDKLLGGPQAGIIVGRAELVERCRRHPLARALRPGGLVLAALQEVAGAYLRRDGAAIPFWRMASIAPAELERRAKGLGAGEVVACRSIPGGGSLPGVEIDSFGVALDGDRTAELRAHDPPVIGRVVDDRTILDLRTVHPNDDATVAAAARSCTS